MWIRVRLHSTFDVQSTNPGPRSPVLIKHQAHPPLPFLVRDAVQHQGSRCRGNAGEEALRGVGVRDFSCKELECRSALCESHTDGCTKAQCGTTLATNRAGDSLPLQGRLCASCACVLRAPLQNNR